MRIKILYVLVSLAAFLATSAVYGQSAADTKAINDLIDKYSALEDTGDMMSQAKLMATDRVWIAGGAGRMTNQTMNMELQQAGFDEAKKFVPGVKWFTDARDRLIKFYGNGTVAVASFYWYRTFVLPAEIAIAWLLSKPEICAPVVGVSRIEQLDQLVAAAEIELDAQDAAYLEELYRPVENLLSFGIS